MQLILLTTPTPTGLPFYNLPTSTGRASMAHRNWSSTPRRTTMARRTPARYLANMAYRRTQRPRWAATSPDLNNAIRERSHGNWRSPEIVAHRALSGGNLSGETGLSRVNAAFW